MSSLGVVATTSWGAPLESVGVLLVLGSGVPAIRSTTFFLARAAAACAAPGGAGFATVQGPESEAALTNPSRMWTYSVPDESLRIRARVFRTRVKVPPAT